MRMFILLSLIMVSTLSLTACNTIQGIGADLEAAGKTMQEI